MIRLKRAYDPPEPGDGLRFLVDRLWPRGKKKEDLKLDEMETGVESLVNKYGLQRIADTVARISKKA